MQKSLILMLLTIYFIGAGCLPTIQTPSIAEPLGPAQGRGAVKQNLGFGTLPRPVNTPSTRASSGVVRINTELPTLQPAVTVDRVNNGALDRIQFQNLTQALNMPIGMIGKQPKNTALNFSWSNENQVSWSYQSAEHKLIYSDPSKTPQTSTVSDWPDNERAVDAAVKFLNTIGIDKKTYRNPTIKFEWLEWYKRIKSANCMDQDDVSFVQSIADASKALDLQPPKQKTETSQCLTPHFPSHLLITLERVVDDRNIVDQKGVPELGGELIINAANLEVEFAWVKLGADIQRSDYPAITVQEMRQALEDGGIGKIPQGTVDIQNTFFAFIKLPQAAGEQSEFLVPALVGDGTHTFDGSTRPYRIVVPLVKW